jgi:hypothetical protein
MIPPLLAKYLRDLAYEAEWVLRAEHGMAFPDVDRMLTDCIVVAELRGQKYDEDGAIVGAWLVTWIGTPDGWGERRK